VISASVPLRTVEVTGSDVRGRLRTFTTGCPDVLLTARFDGVGDDPGQRMPAAADNAPGVAVVLEAARSRTASARGARSSTPRKPEPSARPITHRPSRPALPCSTSTAPPSSATLLPWKQEGRPTDWSPRLARPAARPACRCGPGRWRRTTAATPRPDWPRSGSAWGCRLPNPGRDRRSHRNQYARRRGSARHRDRATTGEILGDCPTSPPSAAASGRPCRTGTLADAEPHVVELAQEIEPPWTAAVGAAPPRQSMSRGSCGRRQGASRT
jgi:hypothetical protein